MQQAIAQHCKVQVDLQETKEMLQETEAELQATIAEAKSYISELARVENIKHHFQQQNIYLLQLLVDSEARKQHANRHYVQANGEAGALAQHLEDSHAAVEALTHEAFHLRKIVGSAITINDIRMLEDSLGRHGLGLKPHERRDGQASGIATKENLEALKNGIIDALRGLSRRRSDR